MVVELTRCKQITYCKFCKAEGRRTKCVWRTKYQPPYRLRDWYKHYACNEHKHLIEEPDPNGFHKRAKDNKAEVRDDHLTEADYQTWMKV